MTKQLNNKKRINCNSVNQQKKKKKVLPKTIKMFVGKIIFVVVDLKYLLQKNHRN